MSRNRKSKFHLKPKKNHGSIVLSGKIRVTDPCYNMDTWCAGTISNVLPGEFSCVSRAIDTGLFGERIASIEVRHKDYPDVEPTELVSDFEVGVDSGQCGFFDNGYFSSLCEDREKKDEFYDKVCNSTFKMKTVENKEFVPFRESPYYKEEFKLMEARSYEDVYADYSTMVELKKLLEKNPEHPKKEWIEEKTQYLQLFSDFILNKHMYESSDCSKKETKTYFFEADTVERKGFVSSSGDGDGSYDCFVGRNGAGQVVSVKISYYPNLELLEEMETDEVEAEEVDIDR